MPRTHVLSFAKFENAQEMAALYADDHEDKRLPEPSEDAEQYLRLGRELRDQRRSAGLKLRHVAALCDMSVAQLSRIERGFVSRSRAIEWHVGGHPYDRTIYLRFKDPRLRSLQE